MKKHYLLAGAVAAAAVAGFLVPTYTREAVFEFVLPEPVVLVAFGDMMLDRGVRSRIATEGPHYPFEKIRDVIADADIAVVNAEGPFTSSPSIYPATTSTIKFTFDPGLLATVKEVGFDVLSQANNHALDFGQSGFEESKQAIAAAGLGVFGGPLNESPGPYTKEVRGTRIAFVGYHQFFTKDDSAVFAALAQAKAEGSFVIVYPHWGEEYELGPGEFQKTKARAFIDAGADAVMGAHPHVAQPVEIYKGRAIFYSLGNFVFDQSWSVETSQGVAVRLTLSPAKTAYETLPYDIVRGQPALMDKERAAQYLAAHGLSESFVLQR